VTALGQLFSQLRADDAAAAVGWINRDADIHSNSVFGLWSLVFGLWS
jgi:hypothetical protein